MKKLHLLHGLLLLFFISHVLSCLPEENPDKDAANICSVCFEGMDKSLLITRCGHTFHSECIRQWNDTRLTLNCPKCSKVITDNSIIEEIMAKKLKDTRQKSGDGRASDSKIASGVAHRIRQDDLLGAAFEAIRKNDIIACDVLCSHLLNKQNAHAPETGDTEPVRLQSEIVRVADQTDKNGNTLMHDAADNGRLEIVKILLPLTRSLYNQNNDGYTPLLSALENRNFDVAAILANEMADVDQEDEDGDTALHYAICRRRADLVKVLLGKTDCINKKNNNGITPLILAEKCGQNAVVDMIRSFRDRTN